MEDFLTQINSNTIQCTSQFHSERLQLLKTLIFKQKTQIIHKILLSKNNLVHLLKKKRKNTFYSQPILKIPDSSNKISQIKSQELKQSSNSIKNQQIESFSNVFYFQEIQDCFSMFQCASNNILDTYFPLLMEDNFLVLQSQQQLFCYFREIRDKINLINKNVEKTLNFTTKQILTISSLSLQQTKNQSQTSFHSDQDSFDERQSGDKQKTSDRKQKRVIKKKREKKGKNLKIPYQLTLSLQRWLLQHFNDPYPSIQEKQRIAKESGLSVYQVNNWFINVRQRVIKKFIKRSNTLQQENSEECSSSNKQTTKKQKKNQQKQK